MSSFRVQTSGLNGISRKYRSAMIKTISTKYKVQRARTTLIYNHQTGGSMKSIYSNLVSNYNAIDDLYEDLQILLKATDAVADITEQTDRKVKRQYSPSLIDRIRVIFFKGLTDIIGPDGKLDIDFSKFDIHSKLNEWTDTDEQQDAPEKLEPVVLVLNEGAISNEIEIVNTDETEPNVNYTEEVTQGSCTVENNVLTIRFPGTGKTVSFDEYPVGDEYTDSRYVNVNGDSVDVAGWECMGFARYIQEKIYGGNEMTDGDMFRDVYENTPASSITPAFLQEMVTKCGVGALIRTNPPEGKKWGHSMVVTGFDSAGVTIIDANGQRDGRYNTVGTKYYTWEEFAKAYPSNGIDYVNVYKG